MKRLFVYCILASMNLHAEVQKVVEVQMDCSSLFYTAEGYAELMENLPTLQDGEGEELLQEARDRFRSTGGVDLSSRCRKISAAGFLDEGSLQFALQVQGDFDDADVRKRLSALYAQLLERNPRKQIPFGLELPAELEFSHDAVVLQTQGSSEADLINDLRSGSTEVGFGLWVDLSGDVVAGTDWSAAGRRIRGGSVEWSEGGLNLEIDFAELPTAAMAAGVLGGVLQAAVAKPWQLPEVDSSMRLDEIGYARYAVVSRHMDRVLRGASLAQVGTVVQLGLPPLGDLQTLAVHVLPLALHAVTQNSLVRSYLEKRVKGVSGVSATREKAVSDNCEISLGMATQALDFYNLDHGVDKGWGEVRDSLFEEGYLPEDLECEGRMLREKGVVLETPAGVLQYSGQGQ